MRLGGTAIRAAATGIVVGIGIAVLMVSLDQLRPFSVNINSFIERATFRLCPLFILGFSNDVKSMAWLLFITVLGNAVLYGLLFALLASGFGLLRRHDRASGKL